MKAYVVNMKTSDHRRHYMEQTLRALPGIEYEFVEAVNGKDLTPEEIKIVDKES